MAHGTILSFKEDKGYGFIKPDNDGANIYVHVSSLSGDGAQQIGAGKKVTYDIHTEGDKTSAINVTVVD